MRSFARLVAAFIVLVAGSPATVLAAGLPPGHSVGDRAVSVRITLDPPALTPGGRTDASIELTPAPGWHLYGPEHGDAGAPPDVAWTLPKDIRADAIAFPPSQRVVTGGYTTYEYRGPVVLHVALRASAMAHAHAALPIRANVSWLACSRVCAPGSATVTTKLDIVPPATNAFASIALAIGLAFLGGLVLNLMPCVFPVLSFKALRAIGEPPWRRRQTALAYTAGVTASCATLGIILIALRAAGSAIGWGFQLQSPVFVAFLAVLLLVFALAMSGIIELVVPIPAGFQRAASATGAFGDGVLVTLIASACIGPYLGAALGYALSANPLAAVAIFIALGIGIALPQAVLLVTPALLNRLPKPGPWMVTAQRVLAIPLYASALWLGWVFVQQVHPAQAQPAVVATSNTSPSFSTANLARLREAHRPVLVDVGAAWCITCKVNERIALNSGGVTRRLAALGVTVLAADWTNQDPEITAYLRSLGAAGVPLYVYYRADGSVDVWPQLLTPSLVLDRLNRA